MSILKRRLPLMKKCMFERCKVIQLLFSSVDIKHPADEIIKEAIMIGDEIRRKIKLIEILNHMGIGSIYSDIGCFRKSFAEAKQL